MIRPERWERVQPILDGALDLPEDQIPEYLDRTCATDQELREEVERLLAAVRSGRERPGFLDISIDRAAAAILSAAPDPSAAVDPLEPDQRIGPYRVVRRIGSGGMGVVYLAHDTRLDRQVALKLLPPWLAADAMSVRRFTEEARTASGLDHPNIAAVLDIGQAGDAGLYIAMPYYDGETLEERIRRGPLPIDDACDIATQLSDGLRAAHAKGIVHRDVKPSNLIVNGNGITKILDFGVAKVAGRAVTAPGMTPGTVAYMSPEQTSGEDVDVRSDVWSVGVVLYEMITGRRPFRGEGPDTVIFGIRHDEPIPVADLRPEVPEPIVRTIGRCLKKDRAERFTDAGALLSALRGNTPLPDARGPRRFSRLRALSALVILVLAAIAAFWARAGLGGEPDNLHRPAHRIAVLPLRDTGSEVEAYFATGLTGELIARLSKLRGISVMAHSSVMSFGHGDRNIATIARSLDVRSVLDGTVTKDRERVSVSVRLLDATTQQQQWREVFDAPLVDLEGVQRQIAERVATALDIGVAPAGRDRLTRGGTRVPDAYQAYLRGRYWLSKSDPASYFKARDEFQRTLDLDPTYALAWVGLADSMDHLAGIAAISSKDALPRARAAAERALELDPDLAEAHASLAKAVSEYDWNNELAQRHFTRALELSPSYARAHRAYAAHLSTLCRIDEALAEARAAEALDPLSFFSHYQASFVLYFGRRFDEAIISAQRLVAEGFADANVMVALARVQRGEYVQALAALDQTGAQPNLHALGIRAIVYGRMGRHQDARRILSTLKDAPPDAAFVKAVIHLSLGESDEAMAALEQAYSARSWMLRLLKGEPLFDPLRSDPRFQHLMTRIGFADSLPCTSGQQPPAR